MPTTSHITATLIEGVHYFRHNGRVFPIVSGGDGPADPPAPETPPATPPVEPPAPATPPETPPAEPSAAPGKGFPENTPVAEMKPEEQTAYWRDKARKHEDRSKETSAELDKIRNANLSDTEKAIKEAEDRGAKNATQNFGLELAAAKLEAAGVPADKVADLNLSSVLDEDGKVDPIKVAELASRHKATPAPTPGGADGGPQGDTPDLSKATTLEGAVAKALSGGK